MIASRQTQVQLWFCQIIPHLDDWFVRRGWMRLQVGSEEWEVAILTHQEPQSSVKV